MRRKATTRPREPRATLQEFIVPMRFTISGEAYVDAVDGEDARRKADAGQWRRRDLAAGEVSDWDSTGPAKLND